MHKFCRYCIPKKECPCCPHEGNADVTETKEYAAIFIQPGHVNRIDRSKITWVTFYYNNIYGDATSDDDGVKRFPFHFQLTGPEEFVSKVEFKLHPTFNPPQITIYEPPFKIDRKCWGFLPAMKIFVYFREEFKRPPLTITWNSRVNTHGYPITVGFVKLQN